MKFDRDKQNSYLAHVSAEIGPEKVVKSYHWIIKDAPKIKVSLLAWSQNINLHLTTESYTMWSNLGGFLKCAYKKQNCINHLEISCILRPLSHLQISFFFLS